MSTLKGKDILDGAQFSRDEIEMIMALADKYRGQLRETARPGGPEGRGSGRPLL